MKNKTALFFLVITLSTTSLSISEEYVKNLKDETNNNKISNHTLDEKKSEIKKEGNGWSSWSTRDKIVAVSLATACIIVAIIGGIIWRIDGNSSNNEITISPIKQEQLGNLSTNLNEKIEIYSNHLDILDKLIEEYDTTKN